MHPATDRQNKKQQDASVSGWCFTQQKEENRHIYNCYFSPTRVLERKMMPAFHWDSEWASIIKHHHSIRVVSRPSQCCCRCSCSCCCCNCCFYCLLNTCHLIYRLSHVYCTASRSKCRGGGGGGATRYLFVNVLHHAVACAISKTNWSTGTRIHRALLVPGVFLSWPIYVISLFSPLFPWPAI